MDNISLLIKANKNKLLTDRRLGRRGLVLGTVEGLAKQYGVTITDSNGYTILSAPKKRMQIIAEKLHFSGIAYREITKSC